MSDIRNGDVVVATRSFDIYPFEDLINDLGPRETSMGGASTIKISILGTPGIGKSALVLRFSKSDFLDYYEPTIEEEFEKRVTIQGRTIDVSILDTAGQEAFMALRSNWIVGRDAFILGFSAQNPVLDDIFE